jgi:SAM-dependent methyltransferase
MNKLKETRAYYAQGYEDSLKFLRITRVVKALLTCKVEKNARILDIGCYGCHFLHDLYLKGYTNLCGVDLVEVKNPYDFHFEFSQCDLETGLPFEDNSMDVAVTSHVLEHLFGVDGAVREIKRVLKPNGLYVLALPLDTNLFANVLLFMGKPIHNPFQTGGHIKFFKYRDVLTYFAHQDFDLVSVDHHSVLYGKYDDKMPLLKKLAKILPDAFSSEATFVFRKRA